MSKILYLSLVGGALLLGTSTAALAGGDMEATIQKLQAQIDALSARLNSKDAAKKQTSIATTTESSAPMKRPPSSHNKHQEKVIQEVTSRAEAYIDEKLTAKEKQAPVGYISVGNNTAVKIGGYVKLDTIYDAGPFTGDSSALPTLPLYNYTVDAQRKGVFHMHARETRLSVASITATKNMGELSSYLDVDFYGTNNFGTTSVSRSEASSVSSYNLRLRTAYVDFAGFRVGQEWTTLYDRDAVGSKVELNGPTGNNIIRNAQIRYTVKACSDKVTWAVSLEKPFTDYTDNTGTLKGVSPFLNGSGGDGFQQLPDIVTMLKVKSNAGHIAVRGMGRQLTIKSPTGVNGAIVKKSTGGWAVGLSGKLKTYHKGGVYFQGLIGDGVGRYIYDLVGQSAAFNPANGRLQAQRAWALTVGVEQYWTEEWRSNLVYGHSGVSLAKFAPFNPRLPGIVPITRAFEQITFNTFYKPVNNFEVGLEFDYYFRRATGHYRGTGKRVQLGIKYSF